MKNYIHFLLLLILVSCPAMAQKELWGVNTGDEYNPGGYYGNITKYDIYGENPVIMHEFDSINGYRPKGKLLLASNGKLYGTNLNGGNAGPSGSDATAGVLFEYDLILEQYRVVKYFEYDSSNATNPIVGVIEPVEGQLYGATHNRVYKYDIDTETTTFYNNVGHLNSIWGEFLKASDGNLYSISWYGSCTALNQLYPGNVIKFNMATNSLSIVYSFNCEFTSEGLGPTGQLVEVSPGKLLGVTKGGGIYSFVDQMVNPAGVLFEYNFNTDTNTKKIDFDGLTIGGSPAALVKGSNGKIYGLCEFGGAPQTCNPDYNFGTLYEYTPATNAVEVKQYFNFCNDSFVQYPTSLVETSLGHFVGTIPNAGTFRWDADANIVTMPGGEGAGVNAFNNANLIEICRKPSYHLFETDTFSPCVNSDFVFDVGNTNATSYVWKKNGQIVASQTTGILTVPNTTVADSGDYICEMTNECGTTVTMALHVSVGCLGVDEIAAYKDKILLFPNPAAEVVTIKLPDNPAIKIDECSIYNVLGQLVYKSTDQHLQIDTRGFTTGIYNVVLKTDKGNWLGRFVKK